MDKITPQQQKCIDLINEAGCIVRYKGGFWSIPEEPGKYESLGDKTKTYVPVRYVGTNTIKALLRKRIIYASIYKKSRPHHGSGYTILNRGEYPVECKMKLQ